MITILVQLVLVAGTLACLGGVAYDVYRRRQVDRRTYHMRRPFVRATRYAKVDPAPAVRAYRERRDFHRGVSR